jgi:hypothetical protein
MTEEPPPWARPREDSGRLFASRRLNQEVPETRRPPRTAAGPPPGPKPPPIPAAAEPPPVRRDPLIGLITGPVSYTRVTQDHRPGIGVVAVAMSAVIAAAALVATALAGRAGTGLLVVGTVLIVVCAGAVAVANRLAIRGGMGSECRFVLRAETGRSTAWSLHGAPQTGVLHTGDLVRIVPGAKGKARAVEVLAGMDGPVLRRLEGRGLLAPLQWAGLAVAVALLALTTAVLWGAF